MRLRSDYTTANGVPAGRPADRHAISGFDFDSRAGTLSFAIVADRLKEAHEAILLLVDQPSVNATIAPEGPSLDQVGQDFVGSVEEDPVRTDPTSWAPTTSEKRTRMVVLASGVDALNDGQQVPTDGRLSAALPDFDAGGSNRN